MNTDNAGGGEILDYVGQGSKETPYPRMDLTVFRQFAALPTVRVIIILLLLIVATIIILKVLEVRSPLRGKAITYELDHMAKVKKHDAEIVRANQLIANLTKMIEMSPLCISKPLIEYWTYNLTRANIRIPGKARIMRPQEFNAVVKSIEVVVLCLCILLSIFISAPLGLMLMLMTIIIASTMPMTYVRQIVKSRDNEIVENFADFYLMIHYVLLASAGTPISGIIKSYDKTTSSEEMHRFVDTCIHYIDTYGEYAATRHIAKQYREIPQVGKLMRLIRQANEGGDVRAELVGFRDELLAAKKYAIQKRMEKLVLKAKASFNILVPVLLQAIISAMAIYLEDLKLTSTFM